MWVMVISLTIAEEEDTHWMNLDGDAVTLLELANELHVSRKLSLDWK